MIDRQGRLVTGSFNSARLEAPDGALFRLDADHGLHRLDKNLVLSNGIAVSPDGKTLYVSEMFANKITAYDYDPQNGNVGNRRVFVDIPKEAGKPARPSVTSNPPPASVEA